MRLLDTWTGQFVEKDPSDPETKYAILSHTWDSEGEQTYQELRDIQKRYMPPQARPCQSLGLPHGVPRDPPSPVEHHQDVSPLPPFSATSGHNRIPTTPSVTQDPLLSVSSVSQASDTGSSKTPAVISLPDAPQDRSEPSLSPIWDDPELSPKIRSACEVARENGHRYLWIDSCCIDKTSSSELSEAINSMYQWYSRAVVCYAFLADVPAEEGHEEEDSNFRRSRWFTRGWTLQEVIAPSDVRFLSMEWKPIGSKVTLVHLVTEITSINEAALLHFEPLDKFSIAQRFSWAAKRTTTRVEDRAYSLLGLFDINMPTLYGEGHRAFRRLQGEIMRRIPDQTLFAWTSCPPASPTHFYEPEGSVTVLRSRPSQIIPGLDHPSLLAPSLDLFSECGGITLVSRDEVVRRLRLQHRLHLPIADYYSTPYGIRTQFPVIRLSTYIPAMRDDKMFQPSYFFLIILQCEHESHPGHLLGRVSYTQSSSHAIDLSYSGCIDIGPFFVKHFDLFPLSPRRFERLRWQPRPIAIKTIYIPHADGYEDDGALPDIRDVPHKTIHLVLQKKTRDPLRAHGYTVHLRSPDHDQPTVHRLTLSRDTHTITIEYRHTLQPFRDLFLGPSQRLIIEAHWHVSTPGTLPETNSDGELPLTVQGDSDGGTLSWVSYLPWGGELGTGTYGNEKGVYWQHPQVPAVMAGTEELWVTNCLSFASTDYYLLHVELTHEDPNPPPLSSRPLARRCKRWFRKMVARA